MSRSIKFILLALLLGLAALSARWGWSSVLAVSIERKLTYWAEHPEQVDADEFQRYWLRAESATKLQPMNGHPWYLLGKVAEWGAFMEPEAQRDWYEKSEAAYLKSVALRKSWAASWLALAQVKARQGEFDTDFVSYFNHAALYGPYKKDVLYGLVELGLQLWPYPQAGVMNQTVEAIQRGLKSANTRWKTHQIARSLDQEELICTVWRSSFPEQAWKVCQ